METVNDDLKVEISRKKLIPYVSLFKYKLYAKENVHITFWFIDLAGLSLGIHLPARIKWRFTK